MELDDVVADLMVTSGDRLLRLAYQLCHDHSAAQDLVQEALMNVMTSWRRRAPEVTHAEAYVRRAILNEFLRRKRLYSSTEVITAAPPELAGVSNAADEHAERDRIWRALGELPPRQRAVLVLRFYEDLPDGEIAILIGAREATVRSLASRGIAALRSGDLAEVTS